MNDQTPLRKGRKYEQVLKGAREVFLRDGYEGATVDDIAKAAGVSKATLYSYFPDKRFLFLEMATTQCQCQSLEAQAQIDLTQPPAIVLTEVGHRFLSYIYSDFGLQIFRVCVAEAERFPEIGLSFYRFGPNTMREALSGYLGQAQDRGEVEIDDLLMAADQFAELCKAELWPQILFGVRNAKDLTQEDYDRRVDEAVKTFLARYGT